MDHVAIMNKQWQLIPKILQGEKTIESRWYQTRRVPWDRIQTGDRVFFKDAGEPVTAQATVGRVRQFELETDQDIQKILTDYGSAIGLRDPNFMDWQRLPRYCILIDLANPLTVERPFSIDRQGFGSGAAWLTVADIATIRAEIS